MVNLIYKIFLVCRMVLWRVRGNSEFDHEWQNKEVGSWLLNFDLSSLPLKMHSVSKPRNRVS